MNSGKEKKTEDQNNSINSNTTIKIGACFFGSVSEILLTSFLEKYECLLWSILNQFKMLYQGEIFICVDKKKRLHGMLLEILQPIVNQI